MHKNFSKFFIFLVFSVFFIVGASLAKDTTRFAVIGDYGYAGPEEAGVVKMVKAWEPSFILTVGDNNYPRGAAETMDDNVGQYFHDYIYPYKGHYGKGAAVNKFFPVLGNHDYKTTGAQPYHQYFTLPGNGRYYDFTWGPVHFFALNSNEGEEPDGIDAGSKQALWLKEQLNQSSAPFKVVYFHHPPYSSGYHGSLAAMQWPFEKWGASLVLSGHDHLYERLEVRGLPYIVNGVGGHPLRYSFPFSLSESRVRFKHVHGALLVVADQETMNVKFYSSQGKLMDSVTLTVKKQSS